MEKEPEQKYIVSGAEKKFAFNVHNFKIKPFAKRKMERNKQGIYKISVEKTVFTGDVIHKKQNKYSVKINGNTYHFLIDREEVFLRKAAMASVNGLERGYSLKSPMPGKVRDVFVSKGKIVKKGEALLILEAMKMQNQVLASEDAKVVAVHVKPDDTVLGGQVLIDLERMV
ncbi:MAG: acetyl-CoA carboxylase biotin carboxyl carrier protein subunit [Prolixibacteraceae bacterium]